MLSWLVFENYFYYYYVSMYMSPSECGGQRDVRSPGDGVTGSCELPYVGTGN